MSLKLPSTNFRFVQHKLWNAFDRKVIVTRDVHFEKELPPRSPNIDECSIDLESSESELDGSTLDSNNHAGEEDLKPENNVEVEALPECNKQPASGPRRSSRSRNPPRNWWIGSSAFVSTSAEPTNYKGALNRADSANWKEAMETELKSLQKHKTWKLVPCPESKDFASSKWLFKIKEERGISGALKCRYKARLVARGFSQVEGVDYFEAFAPVVKFTSICILLRSCMVTSRGKWTWSNLKGWDKPSKHSLPP